MFFVISLFVFWGFCWYSDDSGTARTDINRTRQQMNRIIIVSFAQASYAEKPCPQTYFRIDNTILANATPWINMQPQPGKTPLPRNVICPICCLVGEKNRERNIHHNGPPKGSSNPFPLLRTFLRLVSRAEAVNGSPNTAASLCKELPASPRSSGSPSSESAFLAACWRRARCSSTRFQRSGSRHLLSFFRSGVI